METVATLAVGIVVDLADAFNQLDTGLGSMVDSAATGGKLIAAGIAVGTAAIIAFGKESVNIATDFESQMAILRIAAEGTEEELAMLGEAALKIGADNELIGITASEAAIAMTNFSKAGFNVNDMFVDMNAYMEEGASLSGALRASIDLAAASDVNLERASEIVITAMKTYGLGAEEATRITNAFVSAADKSTAEVSHLAEAFVYVGPTAASMKIPIEDTAAALAVLAEGGKLGSAAGTALNRVLSDLTKGSDKSKEAIDELGITVYDVTDGSLLPLPVILDSVVKAFGEGAAITETYGGATEEMVKAVEKAGEKIPGLTTKLSEQDQQLAILNKELATAVEKYGEASTQADKKRLSITKLTNDIADNQAELSFHNAAIDEYNTAAGTATEVTRALTDQEKAEYQAAIFTSQGRLAVNVLIKDGVGALENMKSAMEGAASAEDVARARTDTFAGAMEVLGGTIETLMISAGTPLLDILGELAFIFSDYISEYTPLIIGAFETFEGILTNVVGAAQTFFSSLSKGKDPLEALETLLSAFVPQETATQIADIVGKVVEFATHVYELVASFVEWEDLLLAVGVILGGSLLIALQGILIPLLAVTAAVAALTVILGAVRTAWENDFFGMRTGLTDFWEKTAKPAFESLKGWLETTIPAAAETLRNFWETKLLPIFNNLKLAWDVLQPGFDELKTAFGDLWQALKDAWGELAPVFAELMAVFAEAFGKESGDSLIEWKDILAMAVGFISIALEGLVNIIEFLIPIIEAFAVTFAAMWEKYGPLIESYIGMVVNLLQGDWAEAIEDAGEVIEEFEEIIEEVFEYIWEFIEEVLDDIAEEIEKVWKAIQKELKKILEAILKKVEEIWEAIWRFIRDTLEDILDKVEEIWEAIWVFIRDTLEKILKKVEEIWTAIWNFIRDTLEKILKKVEEIWDAIWKFIRDTLEKILKKVEEIWTAIWNFIRDTLEKILKKVEEIWTAIWNFIRDTLEKILGKVEEIWAAIWNFIRDTLDDILAKVTEIWTAIWNKIRDTLDDILRKVQEIWSTIWTTIRDTLADILREVQNVWASIQTAIQTALDSIIDAVRTWATNLYNEFLAALQSLLNAINEVRDDLIAIGVQIIEYIIQGIQSVGDFVDTMADQLSEWLSDLVSAGQDWFADAMAIGAKIITMIKSGLSGAWQAFITWIGDLFRGAVSGFDSIADLAASAWNKVKEIGNEIVTRIREGIESAWDGFLKWLWGEIEKIADDLPFFSSGQTMGQSLAEGIASGLQGTQAALNAAVQAAQAGAPGSTVGTMAAAGGAGGGAYQAGPFYTTVNTEMDMNELMYKVEQAIRAIQSRGESL